VKIGVVSDTHNFVDPKVPALLVGVEHILHAGDIGLPRVVLELQAIAPVTAVLGNTDEAGFHYRLTEVVELAGRRFLVRHIVNPHYPDEGLSRLLAQVQPDVVVFGHTHKPFCERIGRTLFFNPGYTGKSRFGMERSLAVLHCDKREIRAEYMVLD
jgi:uncharacterized protein